MKEKIIKILVIVMTVSVIALIILQIAWINNTMKIEEERFDKSVNEALLTAAEKLAKEETAHIVFKELAGGRKDVFVYLKKDGDKNQDAKDKNLTKQLRIVHVDSAKKGFSGYRVTYSDSSKGKNNVEVFENRTVVPHNLKWNTKIDTVHIKQKQLVQNVVTELVSENTAKKIEDRVSVSKLDSLLTGEFNNSGINTEFYFGVNKLENDSLTLLKKGVDINKLHKSHFRTLLFPEEVFFNPNQLIVYFPNEKSFIFGSVAGMLGLSILLILIISGVFFKTVQLFLRQKKITEIKNDLINNITHEFKTPISTISIACEALNEPKLTKDLTAVNKYSGIIKEENDRLRIMVENLLTTAAFEAAKPNGNNGSRHLAEHNIKIDDVILPAVRKFEEVLKQKNGKIILDGLPSDILVFGDKFHLTNIIGNLIDNAIKYNNDNPEIKICIRKDEKNVFVEISDNGIGIAKEYINKIFDTFYRVPTGNIHNVRGNGIGLSYAKKIIVSHNGNISVHSVLGKGSVFEINLPMSNNL